MSVMDHDTTMRVNWATLNVPTVASLITIASILGGLLWAQSARQERQDARIDTIERQFAAAVASDNERYKAGMEIVNQIPNIAYRMTVAEQGIVALNQRQDRFSEAMGDLRDGISKVNTSIQVLTERIESAVPLKKMQER